MGHLRDTIYKEIAPRKTLQSCVDGVWYSEAVAPHTLHILPTTRSTLMTCDTPYGKGVVLVGALSNNTTVELEQGNIKVGAWLKPGALYTFSQHEPRELRDKVVLGSDMGRKVREFEVAITSANTPQEKLEILQDLVESLIAEEMIVRHVIVDRFIAAIQKSSGYVSVEAIMRELPIGYRQCLRLIKQYTGFTPKEFLKLHQFSLAAHALGTTRQSITAVAAAHNYADHSHFTREFRSRVGVVPSSFGNHQAL